MKALEAVIKFCTSNKFSLGEKVGEGFHGEVFTVPSASDQIIKLSYMTDTMARRPVGEFFKDLKEIVALQQEHAYSCFVKVFDFGLLYQGERELFDKTKENFLLYYMVMERLLPLSEDEKKVIKTICSADRSYHLKLIDDNCFKLIEEQSYWLDFDKNKLIAFLKQVRDNPIRHCDFHKRNIMKDCNNNFKLIDLDFSTLGN